jgi:PBP1b-binding outer membrane lipoprotein LpoB
MKINKYYSLILIGIIALLFSSCSTVKDAFDPQRKNSSEEFLVEKKSPLSMPPKFNELPIPSSEKVDKESQISNIESLIIDKDSNEKSEIIESDKDFEELILDKIKNN